MSMLQDAKMKLSLSRVAYENNQHEIDLPEKTTNDGEILEKDCKIFTPRAILSKGRPQVKRKQSRVEKEVQKRKVRKKTDKIEQTK